MLRHPIEFAQFAEAEPFIGAAGTESLAAFVAESALALVIPSAAFTAPVLALRWIIRTIWHVRKVFHSRVLLVRHLPPVLRSNVLQPR